MAYSIDKKLVVGVSSNALFNLEKEDNIFKEKGEIEYKKFQLENKDKILDSGIAMPFIKRFLNINKVYSTEQPVEVAILSRNSPEIGIRIFNSIKSHNLNISRAAFTSGKPPYKYIRPFNISLFLSTNEEDVNNAVCAGFGAGHVLKTNVMDEDSDMSLRVAFDFDGVLADDEAEKVYETGSIDLFHEYEAQHANEVHSPGPLAEFFKKLSYFQKMESKKLLADKNYKKIVQTAIITARNAPSHERALNTLNSWNVTVDDMFFLGGIEKKSILEELKPHIFFDDQKNHLDSTIVNIPLVHIPFGVKNKNSQL